jgi:hypothetical protein
MRRLPSPAVGISQLGIRRVEQEYQARRASRVQRVRVSGGALLLALATHCVLTAPLVALVMERGSLPALDDFASHLGVNLCALPITCFLARLYIHNRRRAQQARSQLAELDSLRKQ